MLELRPTCEHCNKVLPPTRRMRAYAAMSAHFAQRAWIRSSRTCVPTAAADLFRDLCARRRTGGATTTSARIREHEGPAPAGRPGRPCPFRGRDQRRASPRALASRVIAVTTSESDKLFAGSIPKLYEECLVPMIFEPVRGRSRPSPGDTEALPRLEVAGRHRRRHTASRVRTSGERFHCRDRPQSTGCWTWLPASEPVARSSGGRPTRRSCPSAMARVDAVVCQFGAMFFPDKAIAFAEARRVLRAGGVFLFNVWDRNRGENEFADAVTSALACVFPQDPPRFMARTPHGYHDTEGGTPRSSQRRLCVAASHRHCRRERPGRRRHAWSQSPYARGRRCAPKSRRATSPGSAEATDITAAALVRRFGAGAVEGKIQAHVVAVER